MAGIPDEIMENILTRLPVKSISRFRCVSKNWYLLFRNPNFIKNHLHHANLINNFKILVTNFEFNDHKPIETYFYAIESNVLSSSSSSTSPVLGPALEIDYPFMSRESAPEIIGSCNGLVCIQPFFETICIWNPATREYKPILKPSANPRLFSYAAYGFGFDSKNGDYKVLRTVGFVVGGVPEASLYSLASNSWKKLGSIPYRFMPYELSVGVSKGIFLDGVLYWVANGIKSRVIVCFDISNEAFHDMPLPNLQTRMRTTISSLDLGIWEGKLCLLHRDHHMEDAGVLKHHVEVWTMMDNKWSKHLKITAQTTNLYYARPIQTLPNGEILLLGGPRARGEVDIGLMSYNPNLESARVLNVHGLEDFRVETYIETLVALNSGTYVGQ